MSVLRKLRRTIEETPRSLITLEALEPRVLLNADLSIASFANDTAGPYAWGDGPSLAADIDNIGSVDAPSFDAKIFFSQDNLIDGGDVKLDLFTDPGILIGGTSINDRSVTFPGAGTDGDYFLILQVDTADAVVELDETNNTLTPWPFLSPLPRRPRQTPISSPSASPRLLTPRSARPLALTTIFRIPPPMPPAPLTSLSSFPPTRFLI